MKDGGAFRCCSSALFFALITASDFGFSFSALSFASSRCAFRIASSASRFFFSSSSALRLSFLLPLPLPQLLREP